VTIYDYGHTADGIFYYAMELVDGLTLTKIVEEDGRMPAARVIHVLAQVAGSLAEAHELGLVHRDINPSNIMLARQGGVDDMVKVLDFGLIKDVEHRGQAQITRTNAFVGTPHFASPEAVSNPSRVDYRSDLYEVGGVGYYLLTGSCVFDGAAPFILADHHLHTTPESPSARIGEPVAEDLERLLLACLAKDPAERPASAGRLQESLRACRDAGAWTPSDATRWWDHRGAGLLQEQQSAVDQDPANQQTLPLAQ
jgi:serine/threonine-protein kinase